MVTSQSRQNHCLVHPPRLRPNPLTTPCLCWCCRSALTCPGRSNLWYQVLIDHKPRPRRIPSPPHHWDGPHRQLLYTMEYQGPWKENWWFCRTFLDIFILKLAKPARGWCVYWVGGGEEGTDVLCNPHRRLHTGAVSSDLSATISRLVCFSVSCRKSQGLVFICCWKSHSRTTWYHSISAKEAAGVNGFCENLVTGGVKMTGNSCV